MNSVRRLFQSKTTTLVVILSSASAFYIYSPTGSLNKVMGLDASSFSSKAEVPSPSLVQSIVNDQTKFNGSSFSLAYRRYEVFLTATRVFADYKLLQYRCDQIDDTEEGEKLKDKLWDDAHQRNAEFLYSKFASLAGLWIKLGQYISSRADIMPDPYLKVLSKCQDSLPGKPFSEIKKLIESELKRPLNEMFESVEEFPLAVASIASVHRATLVGGRKVAIKVQHSEIAERLIQDLQNLETIGNVVRYLDADFDMSPVIREWAKEVPKELDFLQEASNMQCVEKNISPFYKFPNKDMSIDVHFADVIPDMVTQKVLVMSYIDGFKIDNKECLDQYGIDRSDILQHITRAYAHQIFVDGFFSGDPHPGNILVESASKTPVLLDFGLTKKLTPEIRFQFAKLLVAADEQDINGLLQALEGVGLRLRTDVPFDVNLLSKYFFRDAKSSAIAQVESKERREEWKQKELMKHKSLYLGDKVDVSLRNMIGIRKVKKGEIIAVGGVDDDELTVRCVNGKQITAKRSQVKLQKLRSPIDAWPDAFIFFERVLGLLRGLTASLDVSQSYLDVMTPFARLALSRYTAHESIEPELLNDELLTQHLVLGNASIPQPAAGVDALGDVKALLDELVSSGDILGCQVVVIKNDETVVELCCGVRDPYECVPVQTDTLFNCFSVTKGIAAACIHLLAAQGKIDINAPVSQYWPEFTNNGKSNITVAHVLNHQAGLSNAGLEELSRDPYLTCDTKFMTSVMADAAADTAPGTETKYHYLSFGWLLEGLVHKVTGLELKEFVKREIAAKLSLENELMIGISGSEDTEESQRLPLATLVMRRKEAESTVTAAASRTAPSTLPKVDVKKASTKDVPVTLSNSKRPAGAPSMLMNPTFFNHPRIRRSSIPAANGHFSARGLAVFYNSLLPTSASSSSVSSEDSTTIKLFGPKGLNLLNNNKIEKSLVTVAENESMLQGEQGSFLLGFQLYPSATKRESESESENGQMSPPISAFGHVGLGGSIAFCDQQSNGDNIAVAVTLNRLSIKSTATRKIIEKVYEKLNLPIPAVFAS